jgi:hypothetical protein
MFVNEVDRLLDRQCSLSFTNDYQIFDISRRFGIRAPSIVLFDHDKIEVLFYIQRGAEKYREVKIFLDSLNAKDSYGNWVVSSKADRYDELSIIQELSRIPSFSIDGIYLDKGDLHLHFRFHSNFNEPLSAVLGHYVSRFPNFHIQRLGPSPGLFQILKNAATYVPLSQISTVNVHEAGPVEENPLGTDWTREVKFISTDGLIHAIYKAGTFSEKLDRKVTAISPDEGIYEATTENRFVDFYSRKTNNDAISSFSRIQSAKGNTLFSNSVFPRSYLKNYLKIISEAREQFRDWRISLLHVGDFP